MFTTYIVYVFCIGLLVWGGKFSGFKNQFHSDSTSLEVTKCLRGFAAIGVIIHHIALEQAFQKANGNGIPGELSLFLNAGYRFVAIFFFCSGYGLIKSFETKPDYLKPFMKKRVLKAIVIPYYVSIVIFAVFRFATGERLSPVLWITNFLGITMMNSYAWYPVVAAILYTAFFVIFKNIRNQKICFSLMALLILLLGVVFCVNGHFTWWAGEKNWWLDWNCELHKKWWTGNNVWWFSGEWWVNSAPALFVGMLFARFEKQITVWFKKIYWLKLSGVLLIMACFYLLTSFALTKFGYWTEFSGRGEGTLNKLITYFMQIPESMWLGPTLFVIMMKYYVQNPVAKFFGNYSLETYMMNLIAITSFRFLLYTKETLHVPFGMQPYYWKGRFNLLVYAVCVFVLSIILGVIYKKLCGLISFSKK
jgi:hypothetical protein